MTFESISIIYKINWDLKKKIEKKQYEKINQLFVCFSTENFRMKWILIHDNGGGILKTVLWEDAPKKASIQITNLEGTKYFWFDIWENCE